jgi:hypothetical protein
VEQHPEVLAAVLGPSILELDECTKSSLTDVLAATLALCFMSSEQHPDEHAGLVLNVLVSTGLVSAGVLCRICSDFGESDIRKTVLEGTEPCHVLAVNVFLCATCLSHLVRPSTGRDRCSGRTDGGSLTMIRDRTGWF